jgi:hypothetical protein
LIDDYFQSLLEIVSHSTVIQSSSITLDKRSAFVGVVRGDLQFLDNSRLHFREFVNTQDRIERYMYVYHYQRADQTLIFRYDNTTHYPGLANFPHHKHITGESNVVPTSLPDLSRVLKEIESLLPATEG